MVVQDIIDKAEKTEIYREGCIILRPPIELVHKPTNQIVHAQSVDPGVHYPETVHTKEFGFWYPVDQFEFPAPANK